MYKVKYFQKETLDFPLLSKETKYLFVYDVSIQGFKQLSEVRKKNSLYFCRYFEINLNTFCYHDTLRFYNNKAFYSYYSEKKCYITTLKSYTTTITISVLVKTSYSL